MELTWGLWSLRGPQAATGIVAPVISQAAVVHATAKVEEILEQADYLYKSGETEKLYQLLAQYKEGEDAVIVAFGMGIT
ncbi:Regulator of microtubule dynamics protein 1 [Saguinus oedipus]|uniref:Regulator of microtubule dynamics protein 1 n=1 Tax=Saguinus oedipus TaxID=9490 RepID=A0ABQ9TM13_SAGOE|nr:Regulator of microtubule dynamics protein 1 [Saguinus oedipus]